VWQPCELLYTCYLLTYPKRHLGRFSRDHPIIRCSEKLVLRSIYDHRPDFQNFSKYNLGEIFFRIFSPLICVSPFTESRSNPDKERLYLHLFDPSYQPHDLLMTPEYSAEKAQHIYFTLHMLKLISLVRTVFLRAHFTSMHMTTR